MATLHGLLLFLFVFLAITLSIFKIRNSNKLYIHLATFFLILLCSLESSLLNESYINKYYKQKSDEYIKQFNIKYPNKSTVRISQQYAPISRIVEKTSFFKPSNNNKASILQNGSNTYNAIFSEMNNAKNHIHIEDFIIRNDNVGQKFQEILIDKASQGIKVRLIVDSFGFKLNRASVKKLRNSGIQIVFKAPTLQSLFQGDINNRDHRKIYIIDGKTAFTGGINIGDEYLGKNPKIGDWRDTDIMLTGDSVNQLQSIFLATWYVYTAEKIFDSTYYPQIKTDGNEMIQIAAGFPIDENPMEYTYISLINSAQKSIFIETPYLNLDQPLLKALSSAALRGVNVVIIIPPKPDEKIAYTLTLQNADKLTDFGIKIYKFPSFIHSKIILIDGVVASIGTVNLNNRSMHLDFENTAILYGGSLTDSISKSFSNDLSLSSPFIPNESIPKGISGFIFNGLSKIASSII